MHTNHIPINHIPDSSQAINKFLSIHTVLIRRKDYPINIRMDNTPLGPFLKISHGHWKRRYGYWPYNKGATNTPSWNHIWSSTLNTVAYLIGSGCTCKLYSYWTINVYLMSSGVHVYEQEWTTLNDSTQPFPSNNKLFWHHTQPYRITTYIYINN